MDGAAGDLDRISALPDDLLHIILGYVGSAPAVAKTAVLSRRWLHVWIHAKSLTFDDSDKDLKRKGNLTGFVDWVLAQRDAGADMESLRIRICKEEGRTSPEKVNEWLRYAARRVVKSVAIDIDRPGALNDEPADDQVAVELPIHGGRVTSISLNLPRHKLRLPAAAARSYEALTELKLVSLWLSEDDANGSTISDFVMSCCPRLRRLGIPLVHGLIRLVLRTEVLEELDISYMWGMRTLDVMAPNLRLIRPGCIPIGLDKTKVVRIVAPKLEEIDGSFPYWTPELDIHGLTSVRLLKNLWLDIQGKYRRRWDVSFWLLENCPGVQHVDVTVNHRSLFSGGIDDLVDLTSDQGNNAPFASVRTMTVRSYMRKHHQLVETISSLLMRCPNLTSLSLRIIGCSDAAHETFNCKCETLTDRYTIHGKLALDSLRDVKVDNFTGTDEGMQLVSLLCESSSSIERMTLQTHPTAAVKEKKHTTLFRQRRSKMLAKIGRLFCVN